MSSNDSASTLQSTIDSVKGAVHSVLGTGTDKEEDQVSTSPTKGVPGSKCYLCLFFKSWYW